MTIPSRWLASLAAPAIWLLALSWCSAAEQAPASKPSAERPAAKAARRRAAEQPKAGPKQRRAREQHAGESTKTQAAAAAGPRAAGQRKQAQATPPKGKQAKEKTAATEAEEEEAETPAAEQAAPKAEQPRAGAGEAAKGEPQREERLERIEKTLQSLLQEVKQLREKPAAERPGQRPERPEAAERPAAPAKALLPDSWRKAITWRSIGPANMGGRITDLAVVESDPSTFWIATASGGLLKTVNNGVTLEHQFDRENTVSIGAVAVAPSDPNVVWVGTGESNPRNSVSYGDGVYKSTDGGKTWRHMGLKRSFQIGRILIHPKDPDIVYVGALGRLYGPNEERGLFKTTDGGESWTKVLYVDENTGVIDMRMHPNDPNTLLVATWQVRRDGYDSWPGNETPIPDGYNGYDPVVKWGPGSGLYKTTDGGRTWRKLTKGLPTSHLGRIGLDWCRAKPNVVYALIDCENIGKGPEPLKVSFGAVGQDRGGRAVLVQIMPETPAERAELKVGDVVEAVDGEPIDRFDQVLDAIRPRNPGDTVTLTIRRGDDRKDVELTLGRPAGQPSTVWLGVSGEDYEGKARLTRVIPDGPAAKAGLRAGDLVTAVDKAKVTGYGPLIELIRRRVAGEKVTLSVTRGEQTLQIAVTLENRPGTRPPREQPNVYLGVQGENVEGGARITRVTKDSPAEQAGLRAGDVVQQVGDKPVENYQALVREIQARKPGESMTLVVLRAGERLKLEATLAERPKPTRPYGWSLGGQRPNVQDQQGAKGFEYGGVYKSTDGGESWTRVNSLHSRPMYFSVIRVDPNDDQWVYVLGVQQFKSSNGGVTFSGDYGRGVHADGHALWIDPRDGRHAIIGTDGGTYVTYDRGANWDHLNHAAIGQFYHVAISPKAPYCVTGGLQDNGTWFGPSLSKYDNGPINEDWLSVGGGDGFRCCVDPDDPDLVYYESQNGAMRRRNLRTGQSASIRPRPPEGRLPYRFNWNTPFLLSHHNPRIFYCAGNYVFRSLNRGDDLVEISPEITLTKRGSATALAESPRDPDVLYVGTDDGALWVTRDGGDHWIEVSSKVGLPGPRWVASIEASRFADGRVYVAFDGHRSDDDEPYVYVSEDFGQTWSSIRANLPWGSTRCLREDVKNPNLLFVGAEFAAWFSIDRGRSWNRMNTNLPTVAVHEIAIHPEAGEIVAATHGRSLWICDITPLRQMKPQHLVEPAVLYKPADVVRWQRLPRRGRTNRRFVGQNPPSGAALYYALGKPAQKASLRIMDVEGKTIRELPAPTEAGLHRVSWDLTASAPREESGRGGGSRRPVPPGRYRVVLAVDGNEHSQTIQVLKDPGAPADVAANYWELDAQRAAEEERQEEAERERESGGPGPWID